MSEERRSVGPLAMLAVGAVIGAPSRSCSQFAISCSRIDQISSLLD